MMTIALGIPHAPWKSERVENLERLLGALDPLRTDLTRVFSDRMRPHEWSAALWKWGAETEAEYLLQLQDDVEVPESFFWLMLLAIIKAVPDQVIGLHLHHPGARLAAADGETFITTMSCVGVGYVFPRKLLLEFLAWRDALPRERVYETSEDVLIDAWCIYTRRRVWHPVPTPVRVLSMDSTGGGGGRYADDQYHRRTVLDWQGFEERDLCDPNWWRRGLERRAGTPRHCVFAGGARPGVSKSEYRIGGDGYKLEASRS